ncbi:MAG TPA: nuclear transport factor 2 family protein [Bryobacteraceae bacterium]|nr:nuclear transport factor 2 family protein [Bryobacteraceae bacterium]
MRQESKQKAAAEMMRRINRVWLEGDVEGLAPMVHPEIVMALPGFTGRMEGRDAFLAGFRDFCQNAKIHEFRDHDYQIDIAGNTAVVTFQYEMLYERSDGRYHSTGRDLWVFQNHTDGLTAVWRTMLDLDEKLA